MSYDHRSGRFSGLGCWDPSVCKSHQLHVHIHRTATTTIQFRSYSQVAAGPVLLAITQDGLLHFFSVALQIPGYLSLKCSLQLPPRARNIRASIISTERRIHCVSWREILRSRFRASLTPTDFCLAVCVDIASYVVVEWVAFWKNWSGVHLVEMDLIMFPCASWLWSSQWDRQRGDLCSCRRRWLCGAIFLSLAYGVVAQLARA